MSYTDVEPTSLSDAKYHLALSQSSPDAELLDKLVRRFPEHAAALTEFAIALALDSFGQSNDDTFAATSTETSAAVAKAMSRFHNRLYAERKALAPVAESPINPFASMPRSELRAFARNMKANLPFVMKLRDRQISEDTMSMGFKRRVTEELKVPLDVVIAHFAAQPEMRADARFKSQDKPEVSTKQSLEDAIRGSGLTAEQQEFLLKL
ncbi:MAG: hypothetical protein QOH41_2478 [Blastocatellia bacterium]|jgi:hypothetical protein|nr:hypothetical protein [Blastocatellia bacterium]